METKELIALLWGAVNSPIGITFVASVFLWMLNKVYTKKPLWRQYEGAIISAVKFAEKQIPNDSPNKNLARLNAALEFVLKVYEDANGKKASPAVTAEFKSAIGLVHNELELQEKL